MFSRLAINLAKPAVKPPAAFNHRMAFQIRFVSQATTGSTGRKMPFKATQATAPVDSVPATFTIRVCAYFGIET